MNSDPLLVVLSGPAGVGKDAVLSRLRTRGCPFHYTITATTRAPRQGERDGVDYYFYTREHFLDLLARHELLEHATVYEHLYGVPKGPVLDALRNGQDVVVRTDIQGAASIRGLAPGATLIYIKPPSLETLEARLQGRGADSPEQIALRLAKAHEELTALVHFDYAVVNEDGGLDECVGTIMAIVRAERCRVHRPPLGLV